jgi:hypothetical protein
MGLVFAWVHAEYLEKVDHSIAGSAFWLCEMFGAVVAIEFSELSLSNSGH